MKKIFLVYGHYNEKSFNAAIRDTFIDTARNNGHYVDRVNLYKEKFYIIFSGLFDYYQKIIFGAKSVQ